MRELHHGTGKGTLLPPILVDVTLDGVEDIVTTMFNSTIIVYNGLTFEPIWNYTVPNSEVISVPIPGYYNDDNIPDFMVKHQVGSGYPPYYYTIATIIDGKTGKSLLEKPINDNLSRQLSGLSVTVEGFGNDWFLYWSVDCLKYEGSEINYEFLKSEYSVFELRFDPCKLRFNSTLTTNLYALSQHVGPPGISLHFSEDWKSLEYNNSVNFRPDFNGDIPFMFERSPKIYKNRDEEDILNQERENNKFINANFQNDNTDNFNNNYAWKNRDKWTRKNIQMDKDYDISYDGNSNTNMVEQSMDYSQADEVREQRSNVNDKLVSNLDENINNYTSSRNNNNQSDSTNATIALEQFTDLAHLDMENNRGIGIGTLDLKKRTADFSQNDVNNTRGSMEQFKLNVTEAYNISVRNKEDDAIIEKIFKRESLRNQDKQNIKMKVFRKFKTELRGQRKKKEIKTENSQMYETHGVQIQPPTGILLPSILKSKETNSVDLVFSTVWLSSSELPAMLVREDLNCIHRKKVLLEKKLQYERDNMIIKECLAERGVDYKIYEEATRDREDTEYLKIPLGQMTIYRMKLECTCPEDMLPNQSCKNISSQQSWSEYLGTHGNGYFKPLHKTNF